MTAKIVDFTAWRRRKEEEAHRQRVLNYLDNPPARQRIAPEDFLIHDPDYERRRQTDRESFGGGRPYVPYKGLML